MTPRVSKNIWKYVESRVKNVDEFLHKEDKIITLLRLTKNEPSKNVQELRQEARKYINERTQYISDIEMENFEICTEYNNLMEDVTEILKKYFHVTICKNTKTIFIKLK